MFDIFLIKLILKVNLTTTMTTMTTTIMNTTTTSSPISQNVTCAFTTYYSDNVIFWAQVYNLFGLLWGLFFIVGVGM